MGIPVPISAHNEPLVGDTLTTVQLNYEWRRLIVELLWTMTFDGFWSGSQVDVEAAVNKAVAMIDDIYTKEAAFMRYSVRVQRTTDTVIPAGTPIEIEWEDPTGGVEPTYDFGGFWDVSNPTRLTIPAGAGGLYICSAAVTFKSSSAGNKSGTLKRWSDGAEIGVGIFQDTETRTMLLAGQMALVPGDEVVLNVNASVGATVRNYNASPVLHMTLVAPD